MALFGKRTPKTGKPGGKSSNMESDVQVPVLEPAILRQNNVSRLTLDERWTGLFTGLNLPPVLLELQQKMNELVKQEALHNGELERMEPTKRKAMNEIIRLTKEAFEDGDEKARQKLLKRREEIESINLRWSKLLEERDVLTDNLRELNLQLLLETARYVFSTMRRAQTEVPAIDVEIKQLEDRLVELRQARERLALDWNKMSEPFTKLYGTAYVRQLETQFAPEIQSAQKLLPPETPEVEGTPSPVSKPSSEGSSPPEKDVTGKDAKEEK